MKENIRDTILIVDDISINRDILEDMLSDDYKTLTAPNGTEAIKLIAKHKDSIVAILLDIVMPIMGGFGVLEYLKENNLQDYIPVLIISTDTSAAIERKAFDYGTTDFIRKPFDPAVVKRRLRNIVELYNYKNNLEEKVSEQTLELKEQTRQLYESKLAVIDIIGTIVESRNLESGEHIQRVKMYTKIIAHQMKILYPEYNLTDEFIEIISNASSLHDIGKIVIPDSILLKPGRLTQEEFDVMKTHTIEGCKMLDNMNNIWDETYDKVSHEICRHHHERYDGKGYPDKLTGDEIPIEAQLVSIADVYDALINDRCYKKAIPKEKAKEMILNGECGCFSPKILRCFEKCFNYGDL